MVLLLMVRDKASILERMISVEMLMTNGEAEIAEDNGGVLRNS